MTKKSKRSRAATAGKTGRAASRTRSVTPQPAGRPQPANPRVEPTVSSESITSQSQLAEFCSRLAKARRIAFDTEFVSEYTYRPELCLVQVAAEVDGQPPLLAVIDPLAGLSMKPFWEVLAEGEHQTIVHAGRQEFLFCHEAVGRRPASLFDVQIAAGLIGNEYPAGYGNLLSRFLGKSLQKGETRTDWRRRPLSHHQLEYALDDVRYLLELQQRLVDRLNRLNRLGWLAEEMESWQSDLETSLSEQQWRRVSGIGGLKSRELAIVRELWGWREDECRRTNKPPRQVLRDDLIVELARRRTSDAKRITAVRGFERRNFRRVVPQIGDAIERALNLPQAQCPLPTRRDNSNNQRGPLGQFLTSALSSICQAAEVAPALVGTASDVRDLIAYRLGEWENGDGPPSLAEGWRAEVIGKTLDDLLSGQLIIRIADPKADQPLSFEPYAGSAAQPAADPAEPAGSSSDE